ncbi:MAG: (2Fe-2S)-binding protein [Nitrososphaerota archaeon]|jgi:aerobic-type carbon monoxide dehydrogenase small subunit (CoxS/CutS family)|nr:(2Fe-2S)-binding protein [Nitrososphaerota archaeon]MDG6966865.1 (2Fe-2S)-binding protein [Nitrososphaerota archaeon]MDG6978025.1 (2Fe-2S)-binding protein [Nitrososphaerota archaeon]MDG7022425.1 (2Fe-2S)-binding protein [Nitrososphaerota archaeon]
MKISRRGFVKLVIGGTSAAVLVAAAWLLGTRPGRETLLSLTEQPVASKSVTLTVNGAQETLDVKANATLLEALREDLDLRGAKPGCLNGECGACTVLLDGLPVYSCQRLAVELSGHSVTTIEGLSGGASLTPLQQAFQDEGAFQCGFCTPGFIVTATALLESTPRPSELQVRQALSGNLCRCGSYAHVVKAVLAAAEAT